MIQNDKNGLCEMNDTFLSKGCTCSAIEVKCFLLWDYS
jgi:hypothetical protein